MNWTKVLNVDPAAVAKFANNEISRDEFYSRFVGTDVGGMVRRALRERGSDNVRELARKALKRRRLQTT